MLHRNRTIKGRKKITNRGSSRHVIYPNGN